MTQHVFIQSFKGLIPTENTSTKNIINDNMNKQQISARRTLANIDDIKKQIQSIKMKNQIQKKQLHDLFSDQYQQTKKKIPSKNQNTTAKSLQPIKQMKQLNDQKKKLNFLIQKRKNQNYYAQSRGNLSDRYSNDKTSKDKDLPQSRQTQRSFRHTQEFQNSYYNVKKQNNFKIKKRLNPKDVKKNKQVQQYNFQILKLQQIYQGLSQILQNLRNKPGILLQNIREYIEGINSNTYSFVDQFIEQHDIKIQRIVRTSKFLQFLSIIYLILQIYNDNLKENSGNLVNFIGHSASNQIFFIKLLILKKQIEHNNMEITRFQSAMKSFEKSTFGQELTAQDQIITRMQHNNDTILIIETKLARSNLKFQAKMKQFFKTFQRENFSTSQTFHYLFEYLAFYFYENNMNGKIPFLDIAPAPYLPINSQKKYTVVIQPLNVLVYVKNSKYFIRSYAGQFLQFLSNHFQIVFWTWALPIEVDYLFDLLDSQDKVQFKLYKYHCIYEQPNYIKDLSRLGRDLPNILMIDSDKSSYAKNPYNGIEMTWKGSERDHKLMDLSNLITEMIKNKLTIVEALATYEQEFENLKTKSKPKKKI